MGVILSDATDSPDNFKDHASVSQDLGVGKPLSRRGGDALAKDYGEFM
jgi:hypothetical protein